LVRAIQLNTLIQKFYRALYLRLFLRGYKKVNLELVEHGLMRNAGAVLHIGGHRGQERFLYDALGVNTIFIEAIPEIFQELQSNLINFHGQKAVLALLGSKDLKNVNFYKTSNDQMSSSIYKIAPSWGIPISETVKLDMVRLDSSFTDKELSPYKHWVIDTQGSELEVLLGAGDLLNVCCSIRIEVSSYESYIGGVFYEDLKLYLEKWGFYPITNLPLGFHEDMIFIKGATLDLLK